MASALNIAQTGLDAQQTRLAVIANNLANVATTGYKKARPIFEDLLYETVARRAPPLRRAPPCLPADARHRGTPSPRSFHPRNLAQTGNALDVSIQGRGFLQVLMPDGTLAYTRDGGLSMNAQGQLVTASGYELDPGTTIPTEAISITIGQDGTVSVLTAGQTTPNQVGQLQLIDFIIPRACSRSARTCSRKPWPPAIRRTVRG